MIDIHSHIIYGLDDGAVNEEMTLNMLRIAQQDGISEIIATPHYIYGANRYNSELFNERFSDISELIRQNDINIRLYTGNELYLDEFLRESIRNKLCLTLAGSGYVMIELPMTGFPRNIENILDGILIDGFIPVLAHVERYEEIQKNPSSLLRYIDMGCVTQLNSTSIVGVSGRKVQETAKQILMCNMGHFVASDSHSDRTRAPKLKQAFEIAESWLGRERTVRIFYDHPEAIVKNELMELDKPVKINKNKLFSFEKIHITVNWGTKSC